jgi:hypothetical protein
MAQVTVSGKLRFAYESLESTTVSTVTKASGIRVTDGDLVFTATEDLGNGMTAAANMAFVSRGRDTAISGRDASLTLRGGFGSVLIGSVEAGNGIIGLGGAGASVYGMDGSVIAGASNVDIIRYTTPALIPGLTASFSLLDSTAPASAAYPNNTAAAGGCLVRALGSFVLTGGDVTLQDPGNVTTVDDPLDFPEGPEPDLSTPDTWTDSKPTPSGKPKPPVKALEGREADAFDARQSVSGMMKTIDQWMRNVTWTVDRIRNEFPSKTGDEVLKHLQAAYESMGKWEKGIK